MNIEEGQQRISNLLRNEAAEANMAASRLEHMTAAIFERSNAIGNGLNEVMGSGLKPDKVAEAVVLAYKIRDDANAQAVLAHQIHMKVMQLMQVMRDAHGGNIG